MRSLKSLNYFPLCFDGKAYACFRFFFCTFAAK